MRFNAKKCYIMSINNRSTHFYSLNNHILKQAEENPYLGLALTENLKWSPHITKITKKANSTIGFLRRNLKSCPQDCRKSAYISLVRSVLDYGSIIWDPYLSRGIEKSSETISSFYYWRLPFKGRGQYNRNAWYTWTGNAPTYAQYVQIVFSI